MIARAMQAQEIDITVNLFAYYRDEAIQSLPRIAEEYDENSVIETIRLYSTHHEYCWLNAYEGQRPVGLLAGCITQTPWNHSLLNAHIDMIYMLESHRSLENLKTLYGEFEAWAKNNGATKITAGDIGINPERTKKIYTGLGFNEGVWMTKELPNEWNS